MGFFTLKFGFDNQSVKQLGHSQRAAKQQQIYWVTHKQIPPSLPPSFLPTFLPSFQPTYLPTYCTYLLYLPTYLPTYLPSFLPFLLFFLSFFLFIFPSLLTPYRAVYLFCMERKPPLTTCGWQHA